jgi:hypothetical protein
MATAVKASTLMSGQMVGSL